MMKDRFSSFVFLVAGTYGLIVLLPGFFGEKTLAEKMPPPVTHPEFYYGFFGVATAWQVAFLIISRDPQRFRLLSQQRFWKNLLIAWRVRCSLQWAAFRRS